MKFKSTLDTNALKENAKLFENHLKDLQKLAKDNVIKVDIKQSEENINKIKDNLKGIGDSGIGAGKGIKTLSDSFSSLTGFYTRWITVSESVNFALNKTKEGIKEIIDINKINTNIAVITGDTVENVEKYNDKMVDIARNTGTVFSEVQRGAEGWLRAGEKIDDANKLTETSIKLAKISGMTSEESAESLVKIKEAWRMNTEEVGNYSSKVALLDNQSSSSSEKISKGMLYASQSMKEAKIDINEGLAIVTNASELSAKGGEALGRSIVGIISGFKKMSESVKNGDKETTDALNKAELLMSQKGISLRKNKDEFRAIGDVIKDLATNISKFTPVEKEFLAQEISGRENKEVFLGMINNYQHILDLKQKVSQEKGTKTIDDATVKSLNELDSKLANMRNTWTQLYRETISSDFVKKGVDGLTSMVNMLRYLGTEGRTTGIVLTGLVLTIANFSKVASAVNAVTTAFQYLKTFGLEALTLVNFNPIMLGLTTVTAIVGVMAYKHSQAKQQMEQDIQSLKTAYESLDQSIKNMEEVRSDDKRLKDMEDKVGKAIKLKEDLDEVNNKIENFSFGDLGDNSNQLQDIEYKRLIEKQRDLNKAYEEEQKVMDDAGVSIEKYNNLKSNMQSNAQIRSIYENIQSVKELGQEYQALSKKQNLNSEEKEKLNSITEELTSKEKILGTEILHSKDGTILSIGETIKRINTLGNEETTIKNLAKAEYQSAYDRVEINTGLTSMTVGEARKRIESYSAELKALEGLGKLSGKDQQSGIEYAPKWVSDAYAVMDEFERRLEEIGGKSTNNIKPPSLDDYDDGRYKPLVTDKKKNGSDKKDIENVQLKIDINNEYKNQLERVNEALSNNKALEESLNGKDLIESKKLDLKLIEQKATLLDYMNENNKKALISSKNLLNNFGFNADENGSISNRNERLIQLQNEVNSSTGETKKNLAEQLKQLEQELGVYDSLVGEVNKYKSEHKQLENQIKKTNAEILNIKLDEVEKRYAKAFEQIKEKMADLDLKDAMTSESNIIKHMDIMLERKKLIQEEIQKQLSEMDELTKITYTNQDEKEVLDKKFKEHQDELRNLQMNMANMNKTIFEQQMKMMDEEVARQERVISVFTDKIKEITHEMNMINSEDGINDIADLEKKKQLTYQLIANVNVEKQGYLDIIEYLEKQLNTLSNSSKEYQDIVGKINDYKDKINGITENVKSQFETIQKLNMEIINLNLKAKDDKINSITERVKDLNSELTLMGSNDNLTLDKQISNLGRKMEITKELIDNAENENRIYKDAISYLKNQLDSVEKGSASWDEINNKINSYNDKLRSGTEEISKQQNLLKQMLLESDMKALENSIYGGSKKDYEQSKKIRINALKEELDQIRKANELEAEREEQANKLKEISDIESKLNVLKLGTLKDISDEKAKELGLEEEKDRLLKHQTDMQEKQLQLTNLLNQQDIKVFGKNKEGNFDFFYQVDKEEVDKLQKEIKESQDEFDKSMKDKVSDLEKQLKDKNEDYFKWQKERQRKANEERIQQEIDSLENEMKVREEFLSNAKSDLEEAFANESNIYQLQGDKIKSIVEKTLNSINELYNGKFKTIISTISDNVSKANLEMSKLSNTTISSGTSNSSSNNIPTNSNTSSNESKLNPIELKLDGNNKPKDIDLSKIPTMNKVVNDISPKLPIQKELPVFAMIKDVARDVMNTFSFNNARFEVQGIQGEFEAEKFFRTITPQAFSYVNRDK